ncbi:MAG: glycosyltransferase, partial [Gemmatimonadaceae bacterium]
RRVHFLFVGDGPQRARIERFAADRGLGNVTFRGYLPRERVRTLYSAADAHLVSLRAPFVGIAVPTKLYQAMGSARPVLFVGPKRSESADAVREAGAGAVIDPADGGATERLVEAIRAWSADPAHASALGARGRAFVLREHERESNCAAFERALASVWSAPVAPLETRQEPRLTDAERAPALDDSHATFSSPSK